MPSTFRYEITGRNGTVNVVLSQHFWSRLVKACLWTISWLLVAYWCWTLPPSPLAFCGVFVGGLFAIVGAYIANYSITQSKLFLSATEIRARTINLFTFTYKSFSRADVRGLGIGFFSHSRTPVFKFEVGQKWIVLLRQVNKEDVTEVLAAIERNGVCVPR